MDEMKATWNETRMWLAMTQPSWSEEHGDVVARRTVSLDLFLSPAVYRVRRVAAIAPWRNYDHIARFADLKKVNELAPPEWLEEREGTRKVFGDLPPFEL